MSNEISNPVLQLRVSADLYERLSRVAEMYGLSKNEVARVAIGQYVGQVTGAIEAISNKAVLAPDMEKMIELMVPKMIDAAKHGELG